ncbi:unnamed protein product [Candidula unifasciata]|uniref:G-protein coupled receptors family 1 profile domain-containing protein n=1 Tax=Candidula unifasciata TaxID=100452 RepID=A0A8S3ZBB5_9EUPU|nr:unnamed protein product [Candidula unifasciata]
MFSVNVVDILSSILLCAVVLLVLVGNTLVVLAVATSRKLRTVTNVFIVNLACADLLLGVLILPFSAVLEIKDIWIFGRIWCQVWLAVDVWLCTASILNLCCISLDRYLAITRPIRYPGLMSARRAKTLVAGVWLFSFIIGCPPLIGWNDTFEDGLDLNGTTMTPPITTTTVVTTESMHPACGTGAFSRNGLTLNESCVVTPERTFIITCELTGSRGYRIYAAFGSFYIPMLVMVFFYLQIYRAAMKTISAYAKGELKTKCSGKEKANGQSTNSFNREKKAAKTLAIIVGAFIVCWMPFFTTYLIEAFCESCSSPQLFSVVFWLGYCNSAMNPCVYALFSRDFRFAFRKLLMCRCQLLRRSRNFRQQSSDVPAIQLHCAPQDEARSSSDLEGQWR